MCFKHIFCGRRNMKHMWWSHCFPENNIQHFQVKSILLVMLFMQRVENARSSTVLRIKAFKRHKFSNQIFYIHSLFVFIATVASFVCLDCKSLLDSRILAFYISNLMNSLPIMKSSDQIYFRKV